MEYINHPVVNDPVYGFNKMDDKEFGQMLAIVSESMSGKVIMFVVDLEGRIILSTSHGLSSSVYYVYRRDSATPSGKTLDGAPVYYLDDPVGQVRGPAMAEGLDYYDGGVITLTESASDKYIFGKLFFAFDIVSLDPEKLP